MGCRSQRNYFYQGTQAGKYSPQSGRKIQMISSWAAEGEEEGIELRGVSFSRGQPGH